MLRFLRPLDEPGELTPRLGDWALGLALAPLVSAVMLAPVVLVDWWRRMHRVSV